MSRSPSNLSADSHAQAGAETPVNVALLGASHADTSRFAARLSDELRNTAIPARLKVIDSAKLDPGMACFDTVLLLGLGLGLEHRQRDATLEAADESLRAFLTRTQTPFQVMAGSDDEQLVQAMRALRRRFAAPDATPPSAVEPPSATRSSGNGWVWVCDKCSDPQCEHRLLTDLLVTRKTSIPD